MKNLLKNNWCFLLLASLSACAFVSYCYQVQEKHQPKPVVAQIPQIVFCSFNPTANTLTIHTNFTGFIIRETALHQ